MIEQFLVANLYSLAITRTVFDQTRGAEHGGCSFTALVTDLNVVVATSDIKRQATFGHLFVNLDVHISADTAPLAGHNCVRPVGLLPTGRWLQA
jgi:hypothetical protein